MPLYKDSDLTPAKVDEFEKDSVEKYSVPLIFRIPNNAFYWSAENNKIMKRNEQPLLTTYPFRTKDNKGKDIKTVLLRYADTAYPSPLNPQQIIYSPEYIVIPNTGILRTSAYEYEKNFFLMNHPANSSNPHRDTTKVISFQLHDKEVIAREKLRTLTGALTAQNMVLGTAQLTRAELEKVAYQFYYDDAQRHGMFEEPKELSDDILRTTMMSIAMYDPTKFMKFFELTSSPSREVINKAIARKIISFDKANSRWVMPNDAGVQQVVLDVKPDQEPGETLLNFLEGPNSKGLGPLLQTAIDRIKQKA